MRLTEIFLRLGSSLVGWMMLGAYVLWLAAAGRIACDGDPDSLYLLLLYAAPVAVIFTQMTKLTRTIPYVHRTMRWIAVLPLLLLPGAAMTIYGAARSAYTDGSGPCGTGDASVWFHTWPVVQLAAVIVCTGIVVRSWRAIVADG